MIGDIAGAVAEGIARLTALADFIGDYRADMWGELEAREIDDLGEVNLARDVDGFASLTFIVT